LLFGSPCNEVVYLRDVLVVLDGAAKLLRAAAA